jgi:hypothetical protein
MLPACGSYAPASGRNSLQHHQCRLPGINGSGAACRAVRRPAARSGARAAPPPSQQKERSSEEQQQGSEQALPATYRRLVAARVGGSFRSVARAVESPLPAPRPGEVLIRMHFAGINGG